MPPYDQLHFEDFFYSIGVGIIIVVLIILARMTPYWSFTFNRRSDKEIEEDIHEFGGEVRESNRPMPILIWTIVIGYIIWMTGYVVYISHVGY